MRLSVAVLAALALSSGPALAAGTPGLYAGAGVGGSTYSSYGFSATDFAWQAFAGYDFTPFLALEGGYLNGGSPSEGGLSVDLSAWDVALLGKFPVSPQFDIFAKIGVAWWEVTGHANGCYYYCPYYGVTDRGSDLLFGAGVAVHMSDQFGVRGEWQRIDIPNTDSADLWTISLIYKFF